MCDTVLIKELDSHIIVDNHSNDCTSDDSVNLSIGLWLWNGEFSARKNFLDSNLTVNRLHTYLYLVTDTNVSEA